MFKFDPVEYLKTIEIKNISKKPGSPADDDFLGIYFMMKLVHRPMIIHVDGDLFVRFAVQNSKRGPDFDLRFMASPEKCSNDTFLAI